LASAGLWLRHANGTEAKCRQVKLHDVSRRKSASARIEGTNLLSKPSGEMEVHDQHIGKRKVAAQGKTKARDLNTAADAAIDVALSSWRRRASGKRD